MFQPLTSEAEFSTNVWLRDGRDLAGLTDMVLLRPEQGTLGGPEFGFSSSVCDDKLGLDFPGLMYVIPRPVSFLVDIIKFSFSVVDDFLVFDGPVVQGIDKTRGAEVVKVRICEENKGGWASELCCLDGGLEL